jgi:hypothetical protein
MMRGVLVTAAAAGISLSVALPMLTSGEPAPTPDVEKVAVFEGMVSYKGDRVIPNGDHAEQWAAEACMDTRDEPGRNPEDCFLDAMGEVGWTYIDEGEGGWAWRYDDAATDRMLEVLNG